MIWLFVSKLCSSLLVRAILLVLFSIWIKWLWSRRHFYRLSWELPGPISFPLIGNMIQLGTFTDHTQIISRLKKMKEKYGDIFRLWMGPEFLLICSSAEDYECILTSKQTYNKGFIYKMMKDAIDEGLLGGSGPVWKRHRQIINPAFAVSTIRSYFDRYNYYSVKMVEKMEESLDKGLTDICIYAQRYVSDVCVDCLFGIKYDFFSGAHDLILETHVKLGVVVHERANKVWLYNNLIFDHHPLGKQHSGLKEKYKNFFQPQVKEKLKELADVIRKNKTAINKIGSAYEDLDGEYVLEEHSNVAKKTVLNVMAEAYVAGDITEEEVMAEFNNIFSPGFDTGYTQLSAFMLMMGMHKRVQDKLWAEIKDFYSHDMDADVTVDHLSHLPYLDMVFKETMRHFPTGPMQMRIVNENFYMKNRDMVVPAGTQFLILNIFLHKDEKYWKEPLSFYPERFSSAESAKRPTFAYVPFSIGLRNCIGQVFATDFMKVASVHLIRNYEFVADPSWKIETLPTIADISLRSELGYKVELRKRNRYF